MRKACVSSLLFAAGSLFIACNSTPTNTSPEPTPAVRAISTPIASARTVTSANTIENKDGSTTVVTNYSDGSRTEVRTFKTGRLAKVTRETSATGARTARVAYRDNEREVEVEDPNWVEKSMDAAGDALVTAGRQTKSGVNEAADKAKDVGGAAKKGAREVGDKAEDVGDAVKKGAKKTGKKIKDAVTPDKKNDN